MTKAFLVNPHMGMSCGIRILEVATASFARYALGIRKAAKPATATREQACLRLSEEAGAIAEPGVARPDACGG